MLEGRRVVVTGGTGFIGSRVARLLDAQGCMVVSTYRPDTLPMPDLPGHSVALDLSDEAGVGEVFADAGLVVHLAAHAGGIQFQEAHQADVFWKNQAITRTVLEAAAHAGVARVFLASSAVVYTADAESPIEESAQLLRPGAEAVTGYAWSKICDEVLGGWYASAGLFQVVVGRFTNVYGPGGAFDPHRSTVIHALIGRAIEEAADRKLVVWGDGTAVRSFIHVDDAARAVLAILRSGEPGIAYNIDSGVPVTIAEVADAVRLAVDPDLDLVFDPARPQGVARRVLDIARLRSLGFSPTVGLSDGVRGTVADFLATPRRS